MWLFNRVGFDFDCGRYKSRHLYDDLAEFNSIFLVVVMDHVILCDHFKSSGAYIDQII